MTVRILHGDALEQLRTLADESVHSIVTDPPYGLEFMGKEWDKFGKARAPSTAARVGEGAMTGGAGITQTGYTDGAKRLNRPAYGGARSMTYRCDVCGKRDQFRTAHDGHDAWTREVIDPDAPAPSLGFQQWCQLWATECLRVLKPGGHLLSFGGSRTYHRMACAIEDAGFEIRDQIMWIYSQGFPKSLNVSKALTESGAQCVCDEELQDVPSGMVAGNSLSGEAEQDLQPSLRRPSDQREDVGQNAGNAQHSMCDLWDVSTSRAVAVEDAGGDVLLDVMPRQNVRGTIASLRREYEGQKEGAEVWASESCMEGRRHDLQEEGQLFEHPIRSSAGLGEADGSQGRLPDGAPPIDGAVVSLSAYTNGSGSSRQSPPDRQPTDESRIVAGQPQPQASGAWPICDRCDKPMVTKGLGTALKPAHEPIVVARKPLIGAVAANVLKHGTGAINVDGCRVSCDWKAERGDTWLASGKQAKADETWQGPGVKANGSTVADRVSDLGRWPANIIHDGSDEVLAGFPDALGFSGGGTKGAGFRDSYVGGNGHNKELPAQTFGDSGSAARFFYTAKSSSDDRNIGSHAEHERNGHPTVKPTDLMQYLVRLVTPPGGTVLDPFAGSGSTGLAADREGFDAILIEREAEYVEIARRRIVGDCPLFAELAA